MWLRFPDAWPDGAVIVVALVLLTGMDMVSSAAAREAVDGTGWVWVSAGVLANVAMWWVLASTLLRGSLTIITIGWCVAAQVGVLVLDRLRYGVQLSAPQWAAVVLIISAQVFLMTGPGSSAHEGNQDRRPVPLAQLLTSTGSWQPPVQASLFEPPPRPQPATPAFAAPSPQTRLDNGLRILPTPASKTVPDPLSKTSWKTRRTPRHLAQPAGTTARPALADRSRS